VTLYKDRFPYYDLVEDKERGTVLFKHDDDTYYSPEEILAQMLSKAREFAERGAGQAIKECVIVVPGYFNQVERKAMLKAADLAGIKVLQLMNDYMAVALNYGIFRVKDFNETAQYVMFYDMGATSTTATVVSMQNIKTKERGYVETHPQISVVGVGYDRTLGGLEMQIRLRNFLGKKFNEMKKTDNDVFKNPRAMAKLFKEAGRLKNVLSANTEHYAQIEGLLDDKDFKLLVTRDEFEAMCADLFDRVKGPVERALKTAELSMDVVNQVVLVGAGTRVPKVQEKLQDVVKMQLGKNLNTDESATMGAVYKAADLSTGFKVKKFITKDAVLFPVQVLFERAGEGKKYGKKTLFGLMNPYPQKKVITFSKQTDDFSFYLNYVDLDYLPDNEINYIGGLNLTQIDLKEVNAVIKKFQGENIDSKGIKAHFAIDESGLLQLINVEYTYDKTVNKEEESTLSKLGSTITKLFSGNAEEEKPEESKEEQKEENAEEKPKEEPKSKDENKTESGNQEKDNTTKQEKPENEKEKEKEPAKPVVVSMKEPIKAEIKTVTTKQLSEKQFRESLEKLEKLEQSEREITRRATALNNLESFVVDMQTKLEESEYAEAVTSEEADKIRSFCSEINEWLYEDGMDAEADVYEKKLEEVSKLTKPLFIRVYEHRERPDAIKSLNTVLNATTNALAFMVNHTKAVNPDKDIYSDTDIENFEKLIKSTSEWLEKQIGEQEKLKKYEPVVLTRKAIHEKIGALEREMKYLYNKFTVWRPKPVEKPVKENETDANNSNNTTEKQEEKTEAPQEEIPPTVQDGNESTQTDEEKTDEHLEL